MLSPVERRRHLAWFTLLTTLFAAAVTTLWWVNPADLGFPLCSLRATTGLHCPGCGATRATHLLLHGDVSSALRHNAVWILAIPLVLYAAASEAVLILRGRPLRGDLLRRPWFYAVLGVILVVFAIVRNVPAYPFSLLVPPG